MANVSGFSQATPFLVFSKEYVLEVPQRDTRKPVTFIKDEEKIMQKNRVTNQSSRNVSSRTFIISLALLFPTTVICAAIACGRVTLPINANASSSPGIASPAQQGGRNEVRIELTGNGFIPAEITHAAGTLGIAVENTSARDDYTLRLNTEDGTVLKEIQVQKGSTAWSISLQPGLYSLTEANHQQWVCRITVQ
jgi:hypothetical protein